MRKRFGGAMLAISVVICGLCIQSVSAISSNLVISRVQTKSLVGGSASQELIELYNNSDTDTNITNWCVEYGQKSVDLLTVDPLASSLLTCFNASRGGDDRVFVSARASIVLISKVMSEQYPLLGYDALFNSGLADNDRWVRVKDAQHTITDKVEWSGVGGVTSISAEGGKTAPAQTATLLIQRKSTAPAILKDTDNNFDDFERSSAPAMYSYGSIYEVEDACTNIAEFQIIVPTGYTVDTSGNCQPPPVDVCTNIIGLQITIPSGYGLDEDGLCQGDICKNISGLQIVVPSGKEIDTDNNCVDHDYCANLSGTQSIVPYGYSTNASEVCLLDVLPIKVNELLANAVGSDEGNEFIEIYNPNDVAVDLFVYVLQIGISGSKVYMFPTGSIIAPHGFITFSDDDIPFTLVNAGSEVSIVTVDGQVVDKSDSYSSAEEGMAWALVDSEWLYTNQPTPGFENIASLAEQDEVEEVITGLKPCAPNQYRSPDTNRCRLVVVAGSTLVACKDGQYRSETTNRCRSIATDANTLIACNENQERNQETNRCRLIASSGSSLTPCSDGQERNPDTNRCRNSAGDIPNVGFAVQAIPDASGTTIGWWAVAGVSVIALGYAVWEWREELLRFIRQSATFFHWHK